MLEKKRVEAEVREATYKKMVANYFNKRVKCKVFKVRDLVLREADITTQKEGEGKLEPSWEGPYVFIARTRTNAYHLKDMNENKLPHP